jgi:hypothetical protein
MSYYEYANGGYRIPTREWPKFRTGLITAINNFHAEVQQRATEYANKFNAQPKKERYKEGDYPPSHVEWPGCDWLTSPVRDVLRFNRETLRYAVDKTALKKRPTSKDLRLGFDCTELVLNNEIRRIGVDISENNKSFHAFEEHPISTLIMNALARVRWTRGSGGYLLYRDEYFEHAASDVIYRFGPIGERA